MTTSMWNKDACKLFLAQAPAFWEERSQMANSPREDSPPPLEEGVEWPLAQCLDLAEKNATLRERLHHGRTAVALLGGVNAQLKQWIEWKRLELNAMGDAGTWQGMQVDPWVPQPRPGDEWQAPPAPVNSTEPRQGRQPPRDPSQEIMMKVETAMIRHQVEADSALPGDAASSSDLRTSATNPTVEYAICARSPHMGIGAAHDV